MTGKLNAETLYENRIKIRANQLEKGDIQEYLLTHYPQASILFEGLLDFKEILSETCLEKLSRDTQDDIQKNFRDSLIPSLEKRSSVDLEAYEERYQIAQNDARFELARLIRRKARDIQSDKETRWSAVVKNELFGNLIESSRRAEGVKLSDPRQIIDRIRIEDEDTWKQGKISLKRTTPSDAPELTAPKPDLYIALPIIRSISNCEGFHRDDYIQNFTEHNLVNLEEVKNGNLIANPLTRLYKKNELREKNAVCFPCAVIEIKHHDVKEGERENCHYQAANATAAALSMLTRLSWFSIPFQSLSSREIRPVVAFTFIGHEAVVWITCVSQRPSDEKGLGCCYEMQAIWAGDLRETWDTVQLCRIIENFQDGSSLKEEKSLQEDKYDYESDEESETSFDLKNEGSRSEDSESEVEKRRFSTPTRSSKHSSPRSNRKQLR